MCVAYGEGVVVGVCSVWGGGGGGCVHRVGRGWWWVCVPCGEGVVVGVCTVWGGGGGGCV